VQLQLALNILAWTHLVAGELTAAAQLFEEDRLIAEATGNPPLAYNEMLLAAWRGREAQASELIQATLQAPTAGGLGVILGSGPIRPGSGSRSTCGCAASSLGSGGDSGRSRSSPITVAVRCRPMRSCG
jgi:hypothetical protein